METSATIAEIAKALAAAQSKFRAVPKGGENKQQNYKFADLDDYLSVVREPMSAQGLSLVTTVPECVALDPRDTRGGGKLYVVRVRVVARLLHISGEWIEATAWGEGTDSLDKAIYKAITGARKYVVASLLGLATSDDPERDEQSKPARAKRPPREEPPTPQPAPAAASNADKPTVAMLERLEGWVSDTRLPERTRNYIVEKMAAGLTAAAAGTLIGKIKTQFADALAEREPGAEG